MNIRKIEIRIFGLTVLTIVIKNMDTSPDSIEVDTMGWRVTGRGQKGRIEFFEGHDTEKRMMGEQMLEAGKWPE